MSRLAAVLTAGVIAWVALILFAAFGAAHGTASSFVLLTYQAGGLICHQRPERSFHFAGVPLAVCARCFGLYAAAGAGALAAWFGRTQPADLPSRTARALLGAAAIPTAVTVAGEWLGFVHPSSPARALAALPLGAAAGWVIVSMLRSEENRKRTLPVRTN